MPNDTTATPTPDDPAAVIAALQSTVRMLAASLGQVKMRLDLIEHGEAMDQAALDERLERIEQRVNFAVFHHA